MATYRVEIHKRLYSGMIEPIVYPAVEANSEEEAFHEAVADAEWRYGGKRFERVSAERGEAA